MAIGDIDQVPAAPGVETVGVASATDAVPAAVQVDEVVAPVRQTAPVTRVLSLAVAVLVILVAVLGVLYVRQRGTSADRSRALAARAVAVKNLESQLAQVKAQNVETQAALKAAQEKALDPQGYELIKTCVQHGAETERSIRESIERITAGQGAAPIMIYGAVPGSAQVCTEAVKALK